MLVKNMHQKFRLVNGAIGIVHQILLSEDKKMAQNSTVRPPTLVQINFTHSNLFNILEGLPHNFVYIIPISRTIFYKYYYIDYSCKKIFKLGQIQLSLMLEFCLKNYKGQGQTYDHLIIDLKTSLDKYPLSMRNIYVTLSCLHTLAGLIILQDVTFADVTNLKFNKGNIDYMTLMELVFPKMAQLIHNPIQNKHQLEELDTTLPSK